MHGAKRTFNDLKLENVLLDGKDVCKICDFGLAHLYDTVNGKVQVTALREVCGSKSYCAPEVLAQDRGGGYEGFPADVWSCGICLFAMLVVGEGSVDQRAQHETTADNNEGRLDYEGRSKLVLSKKQLRSDT